MPLLSSFRVVVARVRWSLFLLAAAALPLPAQAWGRLGHELMASIAYEHLNPAAKAGVDQLLAQEPGATLASISTWADEHRNPTTARWHYVNLQPGGCAFDAGRDCPGADCVIGAIDEQLALLKTERSDARRLQALKYLVHFVEDIHQPLHAGHGEDRGGNLYQVNTGGHGSNLHAYWDVGLLAQVSEDPLVWLARLGALPTVAAARQTNPVVMAQESCQIVETPGFYPPHRLEASYGEVYLPVLEQRLRLGADRLARVLNGVWAK